MKLDFQNGEATLKLDSYEERKMLELSARVYGERKADQEALTQIYRVGPELQKRIGLGRSKQYEAIRTKQLRAKVAGKSFIVSELACLEYMGDVSSK